MRNIFNKKRGAIEPLIATILLIVVSVILVTIVLTWGKEFSTSSLNKTTNILYEKSDLTNFIFVKSSGRFKSDFSILEIKNLHSTESATIIGYKILAPSSKFKFLETSEFSLEEPITLSPGQINFLNLECTPEQKFDVQLLTDEGKYISTKYNNPNYIAGNCIKGTDFGWHHACAILAIGKVKCWGRNTHGQLGDGTLTYKSTPLYVNNLDSVLEITSGDLHTCAVLSDGKIMCWGSNNSGQLGDQTTIDKNTPVMVLGINNAVKVSGGCYHTCSLLSNGGIKCWGQNTSGQLGNGTITNSLIPVSVIDSSQNLITNFTDVKVGCTNSCGLLNDGQIMCWGNNQYGKLGDGSITDRNSATHMLNVGRAVALSIGSEYGGCLLEESGIVKCFGKNNFGQIGDGTTIDRNIPTVVQDIDKAIYIDSGNGHNCAVLSNNELKCWGQNTNGQLGNNSWVNSYVPISPINYTNIFSVTLGDEFTCAKSINGDISCWGNNGQGQLGNGTTVSTKTPVNIDLSFYE